MSTPAANTPISPALVAAKLAKIRNFEDELLLEEFTAEPRLAEALWFLQYVSDPENHPGGLRKFVADLIADSHDLIGTITMGNHTAEEIPDEALFLIMEELLGDVRYSLRLETKSIRRAEIVQACCKVAAEELAVFLRALCEQLPFSFHRTRQSWKYGDSRGAQAPWYFPRLAAALLRFIDRRKAAVGATIASTEVSREVFHWLHKARVTRSAVVIEGNSRFGKTESVKAWANMNPGLARYVKTPPSNSESDLLRAVALALGIEAGPKLIGYRLRSEIEFVLKHSGIMLIFDEAQSLFPASYGRNTTPARLNWVRCNVIDASLPAAFISTPQSYRNAERKFVKATGFAMEQWTERLLKTVHLPSEVPRDDLFAIARIHLPGLADKYLEYVVERAAATERNYVSDVSKIARLAYSNAEDSGCSTPKLEHIISAIKDVLPVATSPAPCKAAEDGLQTPFSPSEVPTARRSVRPLAQPAQRHFDRSLDASAEALLPS